MGASCSSVPTDYKIYKKHPRLVEEFKCGNTFLRNLFRLDFQFYGDFEEVWKIQDKSNSAIYSLHERKKLNLFENKTCYNFINRENRIITDLSNQFIQKVHFTFHEETSLYIVTEYIHGRLSFYVKQQYEFSEPQLQYIVASLVLGLEYLMSIGIIHRNLRPETIFFNQYGKVKISGFLYSKDKEHMINTPFDCVGTVGYMAPEVIEKKPHSRLVDLYGLGIVLYELATLEKLFDGTNNEDNLKKMKTLKIKSQYLPSRYSKSLADLLTLLLKCKENERIGACNFDEVKSHPWFGHFDWESLANGQMKPRFVPEWEEKELFERKKKKIDYKLLRRPSMQNLFVGFQHGLETKSSIELKAMNEEMV